MTESSIQALHPLLWGDFTIALAVGASAALVAVVLVLFHWTVAVVGVLAVLVLAAVANERFLLLVIFLNPLGWSLGSASSIIGGLPSFSSIDGMQAVRWLAIGGFFLGALWRGELRLSRLVRSPFARPSLAFAAAVLLSSLLGTPGMRLTSVFRAGTHLIVFLGFFFLILAWADSSKRFESVVGVLLLSVLTTSILGIVQMLVGSYTPLRGMLYASYPGLPPWGGRAASFFVTVNELAVYLCLLLPLALGCCALTAGWWKRIGAWTFLLGTIALVCTQSHGGFLALAAVLALGAFYLVRTWGKRVLASTVMFSFAAGVYAVVQVVGLNHASQLQETSLVGRLLLGSSGWQFFVSSPIHGIGWENFEILHTYQFAAGSFASLQSGVESLYFQLLSETGLLGFVTFFLLLFLAFRAAHRRLRSGGYPLGRALAFGVLGAVVVMLVQGITEAQLEVPQLGTVLWMLLALFVVSQRVEAAPVSPVTRRGAYQSSRQSPKSPVKGEEAQA